MRFVAGDFAVEPGEASGERGERVFVAFAQGHAEQQLVEGDGALAFERAGVGLVALAHAHGIHDDEVGLGAGVGAAHGLQIGGREHARAAAFHLLEVGAAAGVAQEQEAFERLDVGAGGDHVHGDGDAELGRGAELLDERLGLLVALGLGVVGLVGDLLGEVVALAEHLADEMDGVLGVGVVLAEDERLGDERAAGKQLGEQRVLEGLEDGADLGLHHDGAVEVLGGVGRGLRRGAPSGRLRVSLLRLST